MDPAFWHDRWETNQTAFHEGTPNALLTGNVGRLGLADGGRLFVPLCGKTVDIAWLLSQGYRVAGAELSRIAVDQLFEDLGVTPEVAAAGPLSHYRADNLDIFQGNIFDLGQDRLGPVDAVYDRAALVALPAPLRRDYARHLVEMTGGAPQLLIAFDYDQDRMDGPPFSVGEDEIRQLYGTRYAIEPIVRQQIPGGLKGKVPAEETLWHLSR